MDEKYQYSSHSDNCCVELHGCTMSKWKFATQQAAKARQKFKSLYTSYCKQQNVKQKMFLPAGKGILEEQSVPLVTCNHDVAYVFLLEFAVRRRRLKREQQQLFAILRSPSFLSQNLYTYICFSGLLCEIWKYVGGRRMVDLNKPSDIVLRYSHWTDNSFTVENWQV